MADCASQNATVSERRRLIPIIQPTPFGAQVPVAPICKVRRRARAAPGTSTPANITEDVGIQPIEKPMVATNSPMATNRPQAPWRARGTAAARGLDASVSAFGRIYFLAGFAHYVTVIRSSPPAPATSYKVGGRGAGMRGFLACRCMPQPQACGRRRHFARYLFDFPGLVGCPKSAFYGTARGKRAKNTATLLGQSSRTAGRPNGFAMPLCGRVNT